MQQMLGGVGDLALRQVTDAGYSSVQEGSHKLQTSSRAVKLRQAVVALHYLIKGCQAASSICGATLPDQELSRCVKQFWRYTTCCRC